MRQITLVAGVLALALVLPGVRVTDSGLRMGNVWTFRTGAEPAESLAMLLAGEDR